MTFDESQKNDGKVQNKNIDFDKYGVWVKKPPRTVQSDTVDQPIQEYHEEFVDDILTPDEQNYLNTPLHQETDISQSDDENEIPCFTQLTEDSSILDVPDFNSTITSNKKNSSISEITGYEDTAFLQPEQDAAGDNDIPTFLTETAGTTDTAESAGSDGTVTDTDFTFEDFTDLTDLPETDDNEMSIAAEEPAMQPEQTAATPSETEDFAGLPETDTGSSESQDGDITFLQPEQDAAGDSDIPAFLTEAADTTDTAESTKPGETVEETDFTFEDFTDLTDLPETDDNEMSIAAEEPATQPEQTAATPSETEDFAFILPEETDAGNSAPRDEDTAFLQPEQDAAGDSDIPAFLTEAADTTDTAESAGSDGTVTDTDFTFEDFTDLTDLPETDDNEMSIAAEEPAMQPEQTAATPSETEDFAFILPEETDTGSSESQDGDITFLQPEQDAAGDNDIPTFLTETAGTTDTAESTKPGETVEETDFTFEDFTDLTDLPETDDNEMSIAAEEPAMQPEQTAATPSETEDFAFILPEETDAGSSESQDGDITFLQPEQDNSIEQEISIDDFLTPSENISIQPANDSLSFADGEISLDAFFDSPTDESISLDNFLPSEKKEKNDIINDPPMNIDLSFDDAFVLNTKADPVGQVENIGPGLQTDFINTSENDDFDFDEMFDNLIDETEPATEPHEESKEPESSIQYDEVSDFDDILETIESDSTPATQETAQKNTYTAVTDYDITVSTDDEDIQEVRSIQTDTDDEDSIEDISLFIGNESNSAENNDLYLDRSQTSEYTKTSYTDDDFDLDKIISEVEDIGGNMLDIPENEQNTDNSQQIHIPSDSSDTNDIFNVDYFETNDTDSGTPESEQVHIPDVSNTLESDDILASDQDFSMPTETFENSDGEKTAAYDFSDQEFSMLTENSDAVDDITPIIEEPTPYIDEFAELPEEPVLESDNTENIPVTTEDTDSTLYNITENHINESGSSEPNDSPILNKIADELFSLKEEISVLKQDFENLKKHGFVKSETGTISSDEVLQSSADAIDGGFFDDTTDDDTIALSGDELTNILNTADFTEEGFVDTEITENDIHLDSPETNPPASETLTLVASETTDINGDFCEPIILEQKDNFVSCSQETEYDLQTQKDIAQSDEILPEDNFVPESSTDEPVDTFTTEAVSKDDTATLSEEETAFSPEPELPEDNFVPESSTDEPVDTFTTEAVSEDDTATLSEEETAFSPEPELPEDIFVPESSTDEPVDTFTTEAVSKDDTATLSEEKTAFSPEPELPEEIDIPTETEPEDTTASRSGTIEDVAEIEFPESLTEEEITDEPAETVFESEQWIQPPIDILTDDQVTAEPPVTAQETESIPANLKEDIKSVLAYMDQLLDNLPEEKIEEFARSEHFELYKKLFTELGLS